MSTMLDLIEKLYPLNLAPVSPDMVKCRSIIDAAVSEKIEHWCHEFPSRMKNGNGWIVPQSWEPISASLKVVSWGGVSPTTEIIPVGYSIATRTPTISLDELQKHLYYHHDNAAAIPYHCDWYYKPHLRDWGIATSESLLHELLELAPRGRFQVEVSTNTLDGTMEVLEYVLPGETDETYILQAHNCHPHQANDDLSGIAVGVEVMNRLAEMEKRKYTYVLLVCPEHLGTVFYIQNRQESRPIKGVLFLEALGGNGTPKLQQSFWGGSPLDVAAKTVYNESYPFHTLVGNDEVVWESAGYSIPCVTLTRHPFPNYHMLNFDTPTNIRNVQLEGAVKIVLNMITFLESVTGPENVGVIEKPSDPEWANLHYGLVCLSNPKYDLYVPRGTDPSIDEKGNDSWHLLMTKLPRYIEAGWDTDMMAKAHGLEYEEVWEYLKKWESKELIRRVKA